MGIQAEELEQALVSTGLERVLTEALRLLDEHDLLLEFRHRMNQLDKQAG